jgi:cardiolipin synthase
MQGVDTAPGKPAKKEKRVLRGIRLLRRIRSSALPVTHHRNQISFFHEGRRYFHALHSAIRAAEHFVLIEYFLIRDDRTGKALAAELIDAAARGVRVSLIYDYIGSIETPASFFRNMALQGIEITAFNVPSFKRGLHWFDRRDHRKLAVIDGTVAFLGGFNIGDEYSGLAEKSLRFHDAGVSIEGSAVHELVSIFSETWLMERGEMLHIPKVSSKSADAPEDGQGKMAIISGGPHHRRSSIRDALLFNIASSSEEILIATPYFIPGLRVIRGLLRAARRGVRIRLLLPARCDMPLVRLLGHSYYGTLLREGIEIREIEHEILHAKVMLCDGVRAVIGSANLDQRSFHRNFELNLIIEDKSVGLQIQAMFQEDFRDARRISLHNHERRGVLARAFEKMFGLFSHFL